MLIVAGNALCLACLLVLAALAGHDWVLSAALLAGVGVFGASFPMVIAHGRAFLPPALVGRGVTLLNLFGIGATGLMQMATGRLYAAMPSGAPQTGYSALFLAYAVLVAVGLTVYVVFSQDRSD